MKVADDFCRKAINFDLNTNSLKIIFNSNNPFVYLSGYRQIGNFLKNNGFEQRQWSGYVSKQPLTPVQVTVMVKALNKTFPWLKRCVCKFDVTDIGEQHDLIYIFEKATEPTLNEKAPIHQTSKEERTSMRGIISRSSIKANAKIIADKQHTKRKPERNNDKSR